MTIERLTTPWWALRIALGAAAFLAGLDKFFNLLADWPGYLSPLAARLLPMSASAVMHVIGVIEMAVGALILSGYTRLGGYVASVWLVGIAVNLATTGRYFDIAVRDVAMAIAAFTLARLTEAGVGDSSAARLSEGEAPMRFFIVVAAVAGVSGIVGMSGQPARHFSLTREPRRRRRAECHDGFDAVIRRNADRMIEAGRQIFRFDTFGDEAFWGGTLKLHQAIEGARLGGVGPGVSPATALAVGLESRRGGASANVLTAIRRGTRQSQRPGRDAGAAGCQRGRRRHRPPRQ